MSREGLLRDLKALHHGRGIRRAKVRSWLGPELADILGVAPHHADADVRVALARLLARHSQPLPRDLRHLFRLGVGLETDLPYLEDRLGEASEQYDRSTRVLRRRLRDAEILVADALLRERAPAGAWWDSQGWQWLGARQALVLRADAVLTLDYDVLALSPHQKHVTFRFTVPGLRLDEEIECTAVEGITPHRIGAHERNGLVARPRTAPRVAGRRVDPHRYPRQGAAGRRPASLCGVGARPRAAPLPGQHRLRCLRCSDLLLVAGRHPSQRSGTRRNPSRRGGHASCARGGVA